MWIITFAVLAVYGVLADATDICAKGRPDVCFPPGIEPVQFPDSIEALNKICPVLTGRLRCLVDYKNKCGGSENTRNIDDILDEFFELVTDACDEDSELHNDLSTTLPCLERVVFSHGNFCQPIIQEAMDAVRSRILLENGGSASAEDEQDWRKYFCLYEALNFACLVAHSGATCGSDTKDLVGRVLDRVGYLDVVCEADILEEVKAMVVVIQVEFEERLALNNAVSEA